MQKMDQRSNKREDMKDYTRVHVTRSVEFSSKIGCVEDLRGFLINKANTFKSRERHTFRNTKNDKLYP